jgi:Ca2+-binding EF-hand superfamily protein
MKAGLTQDEIQKLCSSISYEGKDQSFGYADFEKLVVQGAKKLENDRAYQKLLLVEWITKFNDELNRGQTPLEKIVEEFDIEAQGTLKFEDFQNLNDYMDVDMPKKNLKKIFDIIDGQKKGRISLEDIRKVSCLSHDDDDAAKNMQEEMILSQYEDENTQAEQNVIDRNSMKVK